MTRAVTIAELGDQSVFTVDGNNNRVGIGSTQPTVKLDVGGVVVATAFTGDGSGLTGIAVTDNIVTGTAATFTGGVNVSGASNIDVTGVVTATTFSGNITGVAATFSGNVSIGGTLTYEDVTNIDSVGLITARSGIDVTAGGINAVGVVTATSFSGPLTGNVTGNITGDVNGGTLVGTALSVSGIGTISDLSVKAAVETVSVGSTYDLGGGRVILECDATNGTAFTHDLANGTVGIVSLSNFPVRGNSVTTYSIIFTQLSSTPTGGIGNTTPETGIGTNITLTPSGVAGFTTSARVATASTVTLSTTASDDDIVTLAIHYNGSGTGDVGNYKVYVTNNSGYRFGTIGF